jgi:hypothetical protein
MLMSDTVPPKLPRRDYILLPLIALLTFIVMVSSTEFVVRRNFTEIDRDTCQVPGTGHHKVNCSVTLKAMEGPAYLEAYNDCGYRSAASCGPKPPGRLRIVVLGSSFTLGDHVPYDDTFVAITERNLNAVCPRTFEFQNLSAIAQQPLLVYHRTDEALALKPDVLLVSFSPNDADVNYTEEELHDLDAVAEAPQPRPALSLLKRLSLVNLAPVTQKVAKHYLFQNQEKYLSLYLRTGDQADFLRSPLTPRWKRRFEQLDVILGAIADKAHAQGVPVVFAAGLQRAEVGLMSESTRPPGVDPYAFEGEIARITAEHGVLNIDPDPYYSRISKASNLFYAIDGHLDSNGNAVYAEALTHGLLATGLPPFQSCSAPSPHSAPGPGIASRPSSHPLL